MYYNTHVMDEKALARTAAQFLEEVDRRIAEALEGTDTACRQGCDACCRLPVMATSPEGMLVAGYMKETFPRGRTEELRSALEDWAAWSRGPLVGMLEEGTDPIRAYLYHGPGCPFIDGGLCAVYPVRPLACRVHNSLRGPAECMPPEEELPVFFDPGSVRAVNEAVRPVCSEYMETIVKTGLAGADRSEPLALVVLAML